ncbi:MAG: hypothetical protein BRD42_01200 [Bacteroidetes bacterium QS_3_64_15]|nr:MAG: hypothetical protein BRD42_01200 [Bacteroidetes bacterium QS_3_64_15]
MTKPRVGLLARDPIRFNMEAFVYNLGRMTGEEFQFDLIVGPVSDFRDGLLSLVDVYRADVHSEHMSGLRYGFQAMRQYLNERSPDLIVNVAQPFPLGVAVVVLGRWYRVPSLLRITGDFLNEVSMYDTLLGKARRYIVHNLTLAQVYRLANRIVAIGPNLAEGLVHAGFPKRKVHALYQPFDARRFSPISEEKQPALKEELGLDPARKTILFVGRFTWGKGADRLADIVEQVLRQSDKFQFCLVGNGPYREVFAKYSEGVIAPGFVPREEVHRYFQAANLLVHPSRNEGCPHVVLEALSCGIPVIASSVGEMDNLITMLTDEPEEYVGWILAEEWARDRLPKSLDWERQSEQYKALLSEASK